MNFVFDIGNVLLDFKPMLYLGNLFSEQSLADKMHETIFKSPEWEMLDQGVMTHEEACAIFCKREPDFQPEIHKTMHNMKSMLTPISETIALLPETKKAGHSLYYLSNFHAQFRDYVVEAYLFFDLFDGGVFSCDVHVTKPSAKIYHHLLEKYQLSPKDCLFFDDIEENIVAAHKEGLRGILFTGAECSIKPFLNRTK